MSYVFATARPPAADDGSIAAIVIAQTPRLRAFVRRQVADLGEVEDIIQDSFAELVAAYRLMQPIEHAASWLLRVARNRIIDRCRARSRQLVVIEEPGTREFESEQPRNEWLVPPADGPDAAYARGVLVEELTTALAQLPAEQREVFLAHEIEGRSFSDLAADSGLGINTLLGRKHAAVRQLRRRLQAIHDEFDV